jgi:hypothetical protein
MQTNALIISQIRTLGKYVQDDNLITDRFIYNTAKVNASILLKREMDRRKLLTSDNVFQSLEGIEMVKSLGTELGINNYVAKSKEPLPNIEEGLYSYLIQGVFNIENSEEIYPTSMREAINYSKLRIKSNSTYYFIKDRYLYILNSDVKAVNMYAYFTEDIKAKACVSMYDREFRFPPYLLSSLYEMVNRTLINYQRTGVDLEDDNRAEEKQG